MKITRLFLFAIVVAALVLAACGGGGSPSGGPTLSPEAEKFASLKGDSAAGQTKYQSTCSACHGPDAKGIQGLGKDLTVSEFAKGLPDAELILFVTTGRDPTDPANTTGIQMPPRGGNPALTDQDLADIVVYVRTLEQ